jgi:valacyclovir hydrolase
MPKLLIADQTIHYELLGEGQPLLLMHGWTDTGSDLRALAESLDKYQVLLPDLPGYGQSAPPYRAFTPDFYMRDAQLMCALLEALGLGKTHIMGFSDGGETALLMGLQRPDLCRSVVAWGAVGAFALDACERARNAPMPSWFDAELAAKHPGQDVFAWHQAWTEAFCAIIAAGGDISLDRAADIACPLLLILGENDTLNPPWAGERYIRRAARPDFLRKLKIFKDAGHSVHSQYPEAFTVAVRNFLAACP